MELEDILRERDFRLTRPRRVVWEVLSESERHLSAAEIAEEVHRRDPGINVSSVYRTLALLAELDLVRESRLTETSTWEPAHADAVIHLVCENCGATRHHDAALVEDLRAQISATADFAPSVIDVRVLGTCAACPAPSTTE
ncbi:MAG: Fur family transcriptional regulator [Ilumatobacteraceae bacterium]